MRNLSMDWLFFGWLNNYIIARVWELIEKSIIFGKTQTMTMMKGEKNVYQEVDQISITILMKQLTGNKLLS